MLKLDEFDNILIYNQNLYKTKLQRAYKDLEAIKNSIIEITRKLCFECHKSK